MKLNLSDMHDLAPLEKIYVIAMTDVAAKHPEGITEDDLYRKSTEWILSAVSGLLRQRTSQEAA